MRRSDDVAAQPRPRGLDPPDLRRARLPHPDDHGALAAAVDVLDLRLPACCASCCGTSAGPTTEFETAKVSGRTGSTIHTDRGDVSAELIVDALGWRRLLDPERDVTPPEALMSRGLEVHPAGTGTDLEVWIHKGYIEAGYGWSFPAGDEVRVGVGSFEPRHHVKEPTVRLAADLGLPPDGYQGNWIPHAIRPAAADGVFFVGDSAGHCIPLTAEGIRTALLLRHRRGPRAAGRARGRAVARAGARPLRALLGRARLEVRVDEALAGHGVAPAPAGPRRARALDDPPPRRRVGLRALLAHRPAGVRAARAGGGAAARGRRARSRPRRGSRAAAR